MKFLFVVGLLIGGAIIVKAQGNFIPGYYVTQEGDTIRGLISNQSEISNFSVCVFRATADASSETFTSEDITAYGFDNGSAYHEYLFRSRAGTVLDGFFKIIVKGKLSLVSYDKRYFAVQGRNEVYEVTRTSTEASGKVKENFLGLGHLKLLMSDCEMTDENWLRKQYSDRNLKNIFLTYNACINSPVEIFSETPSRLQTNIGIQILPSLVVVNAGHPMGDIPMTTNKTLSGGVFVSLSNELASRNVSVVGELNYYQYDGYGYFNSSGTINNDVFAKYKVLQIPVILRIGRLYFIDVGFQNNLVLSQRVRWRIEGVSSTTVQTHEGQVNDLHLWSTGLLIGGGTTFNVASFPFGVFARYSRSGNPFFSSKPGYQVASIGVSFQFTKN